MLYLATQKGRHNKTVKVLKRTPQNVIYVPVGKGTGGRERSCKSSVSKFVHTHQPHPRTPYFAPTVPAEPRADARSTAAATAEVAHQEPAPEAETSREAPVPATAPAPSPAPASVPPPTPAPDRRAGRFSRDQVREMYLLAIDVPSGKTRWGHQAEVAQAFGCSQTLIDGIVKGKMHSAATADLRLRHIRAAEQRLGLTASGPATAPVRAEALQSYEQPRTVSGQVIDGAGTARAMPPRHGDGPPPGGPGNRATMGEAATLLTDTSELIQTLARCVIRRRPLPSYITMRTVEELASRAEQVADRLRGGE